MNKIHETQAVKPEAVILEENEIINEDSKEYSRMEGGNNPQKMIMKNLPKPLRIFAICILWGFTIMGVIGMIMTLSK